MMRRPEEADTLEAAVHIVRERFGAVPRVLLVTGSGLGGLERLIEPVREIGFGEVPGLPSAGVAGHAGRFLFGWCEGVPVLVQSGRLHMYEGHAPEVVGVPARIAAALGVKAAIITSAVGGVNRRLRPGDLVMLDDHINLLWRTPLPPPARAQGASPFPDMSMPYDRGLGRLASAAALRRGLPLARGTYAALLGPSFETPAEICMLARLGADVVGMSTVPEVLALRAYGVRVLAFSVVTNLASGLGAPPGREGADAISHDDVLRVGRRAGKRLGGVIREMLAGGEV